MTAAAQAHGRAVTRIVDRRWPARLALAAAVAMLLVNAAILAVTAAIAIGYPFELNYGEGIVWQQMLNMAAGDGYAPLRTFPAIVYHYPPVYHLVTAFCSRILGSDGLATGRAVSLAATIATAAMIGELAAAVVRSQGRPAARGCGWIAGLIFLSCYPVAMWAVLMRVDMLAGAFSVGGLILAFRAVDRPRLLAGAAFLFVLAIYTKQTSVAAPAAAVIALAAVRPRLAIALTLSCLALGGIALAALELATHGAFLRHILFYNLNRNDPARLSLLATPLRAHLLYLVLAAIGSVQACRSLRWATRSREQQAFATLLGTVAYLLLKTLLLLTVIKVGSAENYLIEWLGAVAILAGAALSDGLAAAAAPVRAEASALPLGGVLLLALVALEAWSLIDWNPRLAPALAARAAALRPIAGEIARADKPVIADDMTLIIRAGKPVLLEPAIVAELGSTGRYDQAAFVRMIEARRFAFFVTEEDRGSELFDDRYTPPVAAAMTAAYPRETRLGNLVIHRP